jgi:hypothetical protein
MSEYKMGTVTTVLSGAPMVTFDGEGVASQKLYKRLASYSNPALNDRVLLLRISGTYVILGKIV